MMVRSAFCALIAAGDNQHGAALLTVLAAIVILSILVGAIALAAMGELSISRQQALATQALFLAEAGAYRALAELRHRLLVDFEAGIGRALPEDLITACESGQAWQLVAQFAHPGAESDWVEDAATSQAVLALNGTEPVSVRAPDGEEVGRFTATIRVGSGEVSGRNVCVRGGAAVPESYQMLIAYQIEAVGLVRNARRVVQLSSPPDGPVELFVERASFARWALLLLEKSEEWLTDNTVLDGPAHTNGRWWIRGSPSFRGPQSSVDTVVRFGNCGSPIDLAADMNPGHGPVCEGDRPRYLGGPLQRGVPPLMFPTKPVNPARAALGLESIGPDPADTELRLAAADQVGREQGMPPGIYIANDGTALRHPRTRRATGIYVRGDVKELALFAEEGRQGILIQMTQASEGPPTTKKIMLDPERNVTHVASGPNFGTAKSYEGLPNGVIYVEGKIDSLSGTVYRSQWTIAARGSLTVTDHLVYRDPPGGEGTGPQLNLLGLYSQEGDVQVDGAAAPPDLYLDATILVPRGQFWVKGYDSVPDKGTIHLLGGIAQRRFGAFGSFDPASQTWRGYRLEFRYDRRLLHEMAPPFFPQADHYAARRRIPDSLYEKPVWQELPAP